MKRLPIRDGQESVWDYPRPPRVEKSNQHIQVIFNGILLVDTHSAYRILETSHPPSYYLPQGDIQMQYLTPTNKRTICEFKGQASYWTLEINEKAAPNVAWSYPNPFDSYDQIRDYLAFYPSKMDQCTVDGEIVISQAGDFYGGWITSNIVGPFKGGAGTWGW